MRLRYFRKNTNWGDALNAYLVPKLLPGQRFEWLGEQDGEGPDHLLAIGSLLHWSTPSSVIWGTGAIHAGVRIEPAPAAILAVRGPLTAELVERSGLPRPRVLGDPALLLPRVFRPRVAVEHRVGVVPHYVDRDHPAVGRMEAAGARVLDILAPAEEFVRGVMSCGCILSSSLHGLICADAYGVPSRWIRLSDRVIGDGFKFRDYALSRGTEARPYEPSGSEDLRRLESLCEPAGPPPDLDELEGALLGYFGARKGAAA
jgi:pyruvyltransferase